MSKVELALRNMKPAWPLQFPGPLDTAFARQVAMERFEEKKKAFFLSYLCALSPSELVEFMDRIDSGVDDPVEAKENVVEEVPKPRRTKSAKAA